MGNNPKRLDDGSGLSVAAFLPESPELDTSMSTSRMAPSASPNSSVSQMQILNQQGQMRALAAAGDEEWVLALSSEQAEAELGGESAWILVDSGSDEHCCPETWLAN